MRVRDVASSAVVVVGPEHSVGEAARMMDRHHVGSAVVTDAEQLAGILTERDVLRAAASSSDLTRSPVSQWMTKDPVTAAPDTTTEEAAQLMLTSGFRHLPIVEGRSLTGMVSIRDVLASGTRRPSDPSRSFQAP